jgi:SpoVK/Ycf46/Vps4 family AAA+-type ATPase
MLDNPYAVETVPAGDIDLIIPTRVAELDSNIRLAKEAIATMESRLHDMEVDRDIMLKRAKELHISDDSRWKIIKIPLYPKKKVDVAKLKQLAPDRFDQIINNIRARLVDKITAEQAKAESFISQADVKAVIRDKAMLAMVIPEPSEVIGWEVSVVKR